MNFGKDIREHTDDELYSGIQGYDPRFGSLCSDELTRRVLGKLQKTMKIFNKQSSSQTAKIIRLTQWIVVLTIAMVVGLVIQVILAL